MLKFAWFGFGLFTGIVLLGVAIIISMDGPDELGDTEEDCG